MLEVADMCLILPAGALDDEVVIVSVSIYIYICTRHTLLGNWAKVSIIVLLCQQGHTKSHNVQKPAVAHCSPVNSLNHQVIILTINGTS